MSNDVLLARTEGHVLVLTINNPSARNSIGLEFFHAAADAMAAASVDPDVGAIVFTGAGGFFCSGGNLHELANTGDFDEQTRKAHIEVLHDMIRAIRQCPKPVIMAVEGGAAGAGMSLALAGDLLLVARNAFFATAYISAGLTPDGGLTALLAESVPRQALTRMCLSGERVDAETMHAFGAVTMLTEPGSAEADAIELGQSLAQGPERAMGRILRLCRTAYSNNLDEQLDWEAQAMAESLGEPEAAEGIAAVLGRRSPDFASLRGRAPQTNP